MWGNKIHNGEEEGVIFIMYCIYYIRLVIIMLNYSSTFSSHPDWLGEGEGGGGGGGGVMTDPRHNLQQSSYTQLYSTVAKTKISNLIVSDKSVVCQSMVSVIVVRNSIS